VLALKRHAAALHDLTDQEWKELGEIQKIIMRALHSILRTQKEYLLQLAEAEGFNHVHFHFVPVMPELAKECRGPNIFKCHGPQVGEPLRAEDVSELGIKLSDLLTSTYTLER